MPDDSGRETLAMLARVLADPGNVTESDVLSLVAFAQAAAECANEAEAKQGQIWADAVQRQQRADNAHFYDMAQLQAECDAARAEVARLQGLLDSASGRVRAALAETDDDTATQLAWDDVIAAMPDASWIRDQMRQPVVPQGINLPPATPGRETS